MSTFTRRRSSRPASAPTPRFTQDQLRERRRAHLSVVYSGEFRLTEEVAAICRPLAQRVSAQPNPQAFTSRIAILTDRVHELVGVAVGWLAEIDAKRRIEHLAHDSARRAAAIRLLVDLAQRPTLPGIVAEQLISGSWAAVLVAMADPYTAPLAELLGRARLPDDPQLRGLISRSEKLLDLLREIDTAALELSRQLDRAAAASPRREAPAPEQIRADAARAQLRELGVSAP